MSMPNQFSYTSVLGDIQLPFNTQPLSTERQLQLQRFFTGYIEHNLTITEYKMIHDEGFCWLALANPNSLNENVIIRLRPITTHENQHPETITCVIEGCLQQPEGPVLSYRHFGEETIHNLPRRKSGLYLFKVITD